MSTSSVSGSVFLGSRTTVYTKRKWDHKWEFIMTCVSWSIGLGNLWRFPYVCYDNGGGAFLVAYATIIVLVGRPFYYLDLATGQYSNKGSISLFYSLGPAWTGVGISQCLCCFMVISYYAFILSICLLYFGLSFTTDLPWDKCLPMYGNNCIGGKDLELKNNSRSSSDYYLHMVVLKKADSIDNGLGYPDWTLCTCLGVIWLLACLYIIWGIKSSGKISYFTAVFPYVVMICLFVKACTLPGWEEGVKFFFYPEWKSLLDYTVWLAAGSQCFFSIGIGYGIISMYASYNDIHADIKMVALIIAVLDLFTSAFGGFIVFSTMGFLAHRMNVTVGNVLKGGGMSLAFISYPEAIAKFESVPYLFSAIFFLMLITLGLGSLCSCQQVITTNLMELYPFFKEWHVSILTSALGFLSGIIYTTPGGLLVYDLVDLFGNVYTLALLALAQIIAVIYIYGLRDFCWDVKFMVGGRVSYYWRWTWGIISPTALLFIYSGSYIGGNGLKFNNKPVPLKVTLCAYGLAVLVSSPVFISMIYYLVKFRKDGAKEAFKQAYSTAKFLPLDPDNIEKVLNHKYKRLGLYPYPDKGKTFQFFHALVSKD